MIKKITIIFTLAILLIGCEKITVKKEETEKKCSEQSEIGRYQIVLGTIGMKQTYMIDTKTGRIWTKVVNLYRDGDPLLWSENYVESNENCGVSYEIFNKIFPYKKSSDIKP